MNLQAICYLGLLRFPEQLELSLALLPDPARQDATKLLESIKTLPKSELKQRWEKLREEESLALRRTAQDRGGLALDELSPALRPWWVSWITDQHG